MSTRSGSRLSTSAVADTSDPSQERPLTNIERLLLVQAVYELGSNAWSDVSRLLTNHQLLRNTPKSCLDRSECQTNWEILMKDAGFDCANIYTRHASQLLQLAQKHYRIRMVELRDEIAVQEAKFKVVYSELEEIRSGLWDAKISSNITNESVPTTELDEVPPTSDDVNATLEPAIETNDIQLVSEPEDPIVPDVTENSVVAIPVDVEMTIEPAINVDAPFLESPEAIPDIEPSETAVATVKEEQEILEPEPQAKPIVFADIKMDAPLSPIASVEMTEPEPSVEAETAIVQQPKQETENETIPPASRQPTVSAIDEDVSSGEEPLQMTRRVTRQRRSASAARTVKPQPGKKQSKKSKAAAAKRLATSAEHDDFDGQTSRALSIASHGDDEHIAQAPALTAFKTREVGKRKASIVDSADSPRDRKRFRDESEPVDEDDDIGPSTRRRRPQTDKKIVPVLNMLHDQIHGLSRAGIFKAPISNRDAPGYRSLIKRPTDLKTIKARVKDGSISTPLEYQRDIYLMLSNAIMFNQPNSSIIEDTKDTMIGVEEVLHKFRQTEESQARHF